ncbi:MAG TPA: PQQ-binding-like beta-propeller repeat protein [Tepidisphaeraceae bacterium]|jgi:outer membrane protein assembly factor BamB
MPRLFAILLITLPCLAADWPVYRGPDRNGSSPETDWTHTWPANQPKQLFKVNVRNGFACPVVRKDRLWTSGHAKGQDTIVCLNADTGQPIWSRSYPALSLNTHASPDYEGTRATPTLDGDRLYTLSRDGKVFCLDAASGDIKWQRDLAKDPGLQSPTWGFAGAPIPFGDLLILNAGTAGIALDKTSGQVKWQTGNTPSGYATPLLYANAAKKPRVAIFGAEALVGVDPTSGQKLWSVSWKTQFKINSADPVYHDGKLFASSAYNFGCAVIDVAQDRGTIVWKSRELRNHYNPSVLHDGCLFGFDGNNISGQGLKCLDFATGDVKWTADKPDWGNLIVAGDRLIILTQTGQLIIALASAEKYEQLASAQVLAPACWTAPVLCDGRLYLRNLKGDLVALDLRR